MTKIFIVLLLLMSTLSFGQYQNRLPVKNHVHEKSSSQGFSHRPGDRCGTSSYMDYLEQKGLYHKQVFRSWVMSPGARRAQASKQRNNETVVIPVIVHVIHNNEGVGFGANISDAQVQSQIEVLNADFQGLNWNASQTRATAEANFKEITGNMNIEFVLATKDPQGRPLQEPGIHRVASGFVKDGDRGLDQIAIDAIVKPKTIWNPKEYLNIWVVDFGLNPFGLLGYATFPQAPDNVEVPELPANALAELDGVVIWYKAFGSNFDARTGARNANYRLGPFSAYGRTATHEVGHWLGLFHIFGDRPFLGRPPECGDEFGEDLIDDTPLALYANSPPPD